MIVTTDRLVDLARQECDKRVARADILCGYLVGSVARGQPLVGGTADIDLVLIHNTTPLQPREYVPLSQDIHHDILHLSRDQFDPPRRLRSQAEMVPELCSAVRLYDPDHFFDWVQASACAQVDRADNRLRRARNHLKRARRESRGLLNGDAWREHYLAAALLGANACACLVGPPAAGRRLLAALHRSYEELGQMPLFDDFRDLFRLARPEAHQLPLWLSAWGKAFDEAEGGAGTTSSVRRDYYLRAFQAMADEGQVAQVLLPLLQTWPAPDPAEDDGAEPDDIELAYQRMVASMGLGPTDHAGRRLDLEAFLDRVELFLESWGHRHGA